ncbi:MAG TPA: 23S rRNA (uracil(1939)-C(5))-methyltransferase RlmD [Flavobacteriaceae bacterium]|nr:23S rRNA (uracil(1939)-C(5))-methyltransferase RlmD [Flavobacteriaceae bacterium]
MSRKRRRKAVFEALEVVDAGAKGKAIAKAPDGRVVFIDNAVPGDIVDVQTYKKRKAFYNAKVIRIVKHSDKRVPPENQDLDYWGIAPWQNMAYEHQLYYKQKEVENNLKRLGKIEIPELLPIIASKKTHHYRNKMEYTFSDNRWLTEEEIASGKSFSQKEKNALGFHIPGMWDKVINIEKCYLQQEPGDAIRNEIRNFANANDLSFFNLKKQEGLLRNLLIRHSSTGEIMVLLQFYDDNQEKRELLLDFITDRFPEITSLLYVINQKGNDTIYDLEIICYKGRDYIVEEMEGLRFKIDAKSFYQTNSEQAYELYKVARDFADIKKEDVVYDLYTGIGTIAQFVAGQAKKVVGIESVPEAIEAAKENAEINGIENTDFFAGDMRKIFTDDFIAQHGKPDVVITDPPRVGMHKDVVGQLLKIQPKRIVYVSCNSATQARDLGMLDEAYKVTKVQPVDMFPQTYHIENVVCLEKRS